MANIDKNKIGDSTPDAILFDNYLVEQEGEELWSYLKWANDNAGFFVHGLTILPTTSWGPYSWPWDLGVLGGALKDDNKAANYWGYVNDGQNKNLSNGINGNFPTNNVAGPYNVCICLCNETVNTKGIDLGEVPIVIEFLDDRFDDATWTVNTGCEVTIEGRKITINKVAPHDRGLVATASWTDTSIGNVRTKMIDLKANVTGLTWHKEKVTKPIDPSSVECWDVKVGDETVYHKDKTFNNCWEKYGLVTKAQEDLVDNTTITVLTVKNTNNITPLYIPPIIDLEDNLSYTAPFDKVIRWSIKPSNKEFWEPIRNYINTTPIPAKILKLGILNNSNIDGELNITVTGEGQYTDLADFMYMNGISSINLNIDDVILNSGHNMFRHASNLESIVLNSVSGKIKSIAGQDVSGMFEFCSKLKTYPSNLIYWGSRSPTGQNIGYFAEYSGLETIPIFGTDRFHDSNTIIANYATQAFRWANNLTYIGPIINCVNLNDPEAAKWMFDCEEVTDARIKGLNHFNWYLDGTNHNGYFMGKLPKLDADSVEYLFANLTDLTTHDPALNNKENENYDRSNPIVDHAELHCPSQWTDKITDAMVSAANTKGWSIYIGGTLKTV